MNQLAPNPQAAPAPGMRCDAAREPARCIDPTSPFAAVPHQPLGPAPARGGSSPWVRMGLLVTAAWTLLITLPCRVDAQAATARHSSPRIGYVYPAGGQPGTRFSATVGGQFLEGTAAAEFRSAGITARVLEHKRPTTQKEDIDLKEELEALQARRKASLRGGMADRDKAWSPADDKRMVQIRELLTYRMNRQTAPAICEAVVLEISIAADAKPGESDIRLRTANGLSNPLQFHIGQLREFSEPAAHPNTMAPGGRNPENPQPLKPSPERRITIPATVNGQILPGEVDRIRFNATKGQRLVVAASARSLIPYLADAVPGWFQATLALYDSKGHELAYDDDFRFNPDPVLCYDIRADGEYVVHIKDAIFRGRQDFVYRLAIGELPYITSIHPLGGQAGARGTVELHGWNLPSSHAIADATGLPKGEMLISVQRNGVLSNRVAYALDELPERAEAEPNGDAEHAENLPPQTIVNGQIGSPGDQDTFLVTGQPGSEVVAEVFARRLASPLDSTLRVTGTQGQLLASNDDHEDKAAGLATHHADSRLSFKMPTDGRCVIHLADTQGNGGPDYGYRLHVRAPQPDFELRMAPSTLNLRPGMAQPITVYAVRKDGFNGPINISVQGGAHAFSLAGGTIPAGEDKVRLTLAVDAAPADVGGHFGLVGHAVVHGKGITHPAVACEDMMQAFAYRHLVPTQGMRLHVLPRGGPAQQNSLSFRGEGPLKIPVGGSVTLAIQTRLTRAFTAPEVELSEPPEGVSIRSARLRGDRLEVVIESDPTKVKPGQKGNLIFFATVARKAAAEEKTKNQNARRAPLGAMPALPYEITSP